MTLPASGPISFNDIRIELGVPTQSPFSLASASLGLYVAINTASPSKPNATGPYSISEWYSYDHSYVACYSQLLSYDFSSALTACLNGTNPYGSDSAGVNVGTILYVDGTACATYATAGYYSDGSSWYFFDGGAVDSNGSC